MSAAALNGTITLFFPTVNQAAPDKAFIQHNVDNGRTVCVCVYTPPFLPLQKKPMLLDFVGKQNLKGTIYETKPLLH